MAAASGMARAGENRFPGDRRGPGFVSFVCLHLGVGVDSFREGSVKARPWLAAWVRRLLALSPGDQRQTDLRVESELAHFLAGKMLTRFQRPSRAGGTLRSRSTGFLLESEIAQEGRSAELQPNALRFGQREAREFLLCGGRTSQVVPEFGFEKSQTQ